MPEAFALRRKPRRRPKLRLVVAGGLTVLVAGGSAGVWAVAVAGEEASYRTVAAEAASVAETLDTTGTTAAASSAEAAFGTSGTVASVDVTVGDTVTVGQQLAALDTADLAADLADAQAELAQAEAALEATLNGRTESVAGASAASSSTSGAAATAVAYVQPVGEAPAAQGGGAAERVAALQQAVLAAQKAADRSLAQAAAALEAQQEVCSTAMSGVSADAVAWTTAAVTTSPSSPPTESPSPTPSPSETPTRTPSPSPSESPTPSPSPSEPEPEPPAPDLEPCVAALEAAQEAQQQAARDQQGLQQAIAALADLLATASVPSGEEPSAGGDVLQGGSAPEGGDVPQGESAPQEPPSSGSPVGGSALSEAAQLASDQAAVTEAELRVLQAEQALDAATIVAPIDGTVAAVGVTAGAAADTSAIITVVAPGAITVTATVSESDVRTLQVGTAAEVRPAGATESVDGEVVSIGLVPDTSSGSPQYPVVVGVAEPPATVASGSEAEVSFLLGEAAEVLTVPNSAITLTADGGSVRVLSGGEVQVAQVTVGVVGSERTEIVDGLSAGDQVVLADLGADLPSSDAGPTGGGSFMGGGTFGGDGGGFGGGGGGGVRPPAFRG